MQSEVFLNRNMFNSNGGLVGWTGRGRTDRLNRTRVKGSQIPCSPKLRKPRDKEHCGGTLGA